MTPLRLVILAAATLWAASARAQVSLSLSADTAGGYDSNTYYQASAIPNIQEAEGGGFIGLEPEATLVVGPLADSYLMLSYQGELRQYIGGDLDDETALYHWALLGYQAPPVLGVRLTIMGGVTHLFFRNETDGGWLGGVGMVQFRRALGTEALDLSLSYTANYTSYGEETSPDWTQSHTAQIAPGWRPGKGVKISPYYAFTYSAADPEQYLAYQHMAGLTMGWDLPWADLTLEAGYDFFYLQMQYETQDSSGATTDVDRTDLLHQGRVKARYRILPWLEVFASWESLWGASDQVSDYERHQALGGIALRWGYSSRPLAVAELGAASPDTSISVVFRDPGARAVAVVGTFNKWDPERDPMVQQDGVWRVTLAPPPGLHQYMIWVDGDVRPPPSCSRWLDDGFGGKNCALFVGEKGNKDASNGPAGRKYSEG